MANLETYGDLKKAIRNIQLTKKAGSVGSKALDVGIEAAIDAAKTIIPGIGTAKSAVDFIRAFVKAPDTKKTKTWLDKLQVDDETSAIIDDTVENGFIQLITKAIESEPDTKSLEDDFNMNAKLVDYLKNTYAGRTITGIQENTMKKSEFKKLIREQILEVTTEPVIKGTINTNLFKKLGVEGFDPSKFTTTINLVKNNKSLNLAANKILADIMIAMIKTNDDNLLNQIFSNLKQIEAK
jgi:hypothetical protein